MKPFQKVLAAALAVILIASVAGCVPISLSKENAFTLKDGDTTVDYSVGMYIYALSGAYNEAKTKASDVKDYKENEPFVDLTIKDDDGKKVVAKDWIKSEARNSMLSFVAVDALAEKEGATWDEAEIKESEETAKTYWDIGPYAQYNYYAPVKDQVEQYGVSFESYKQIVTGSVKQSALFEVLYTKGGSQEVSDDDLSTYYKKNYIGYSYIPVHLYTSTTDDDGNSTSKAFGKKKIAKITEELEALVADITSGKKSFDDVSKACQKSYDVAESDVVKDTVSTKEDAKSNNADIYKAIKKLSKGAAELVTVGTDGDSPVAYIAVKGEVNAKLKEVLKSDSERLTVLQGMKSDDFEDYLVEQGEKLVKDGKAVENSGVMNKYDAGMFFVKAEETTAATEAEADDDSDADADADAE